MASEADTRANYIDPALQAGGWQKTQIIREYYFTDGRIHLGGQRGSRCFVDYLLHNNNRHLAIVEAKKDSEHPTKGLQQAIDYANKLKIRFVYTSNGKQIYEWDMQTGKGDYITNYPSPAELEQRYLGINAPIEQIFRDTPYHLQGPFRPRYYQELAINAVTDAIAQANKRILLTLATGTGKTFIAFQIVHKLFQARWTLNNLGQRRPRVLFLADRNVLADQAINTFNPYEKELIKINGEEIKKRYGEVPTNAQIFFAIYQAIAEKENIGGYYKQYPANFFDLVIIDECHRGSANEEGSWRAILNHFSSAVHLGLTATPKRTDNVDTYDYFGEPVYQYSLKEGIDDGFLTPYRVKRVSTTLDYLVLNDQDIIIEGEATQDNFTEKDYDKKIKVDDRTELVAKTILENIKSLDKTIIFCESQPHALTMRDMINKHKDNKDPNYCVRITSDEGKGGRDLLEKFQDNDKDIPTLVTTSQMLTTGVDARNVRNIVLDRTINSMVEFKQIIGRGTRLFEGKDHFTIIDFRKATDKFYDDEWDGEPEPPAGGKPETPNTPKPPIDEGDITGGPKELPKPILTVKLGQHREKKVTNIETRYIDENGRPISIQEFIDKLLNLLPELFKSIDELRERWASPEKRKELFQQLAQQGFNEEQLISLRKLFEAEECDLFDFLAFLMFELPMATRHDRANAVRENQPFFNQYQQPKAKDFLFFILDRYEKTGIAELDQEHLPTLITLSNLGTTNDAIQAFNGNPESLIEAFKQLQYQLYQVS